MITLTIKLDEEQLQLLIKVFDEAAEKALIKAINKLHKEIKK